MIKSNICPKCNGNGYRMIWKDANKKEKIDIQCSYCESEGEIKNFVRFEEHSDEEYAQHCKKFFKGEKDE